jgi:outer membrane protein OmpA-like peptidoglycan-associated protein
MKRIMLSRFHFIFLVLILLSRNLMGVEETGIGYHSAVFMRIHPTARQVAMGNAFTGLADDVNLLRYNIGGLGNLRYIMASVNFHNWIDDTQQGSVSLSLPHSLGVFGFDFSYFNEGEIEVLDEKFRLTGGTVSSSDIMLTLAYGNYLNIFNYDFSFGGGIKILRQSLVGIENTSYALDLGAQYKIKYVSLGATIQNFALSKPKFHETDFTLPETYRVGSALTMPIGKSLQMNLAADIAWIREQNLRYYTGAELIIADLLALRSGYKIHSTEASRWGIGMGLNIPMEWLANSNTRLDYAYSPVDAFESSIHRFSLLFTFDVAHRIYALNYADRERFSEMSEKLHRELEEAERARQDIEDAKTRALAMEEELETRMAHIKQIAAESEGKIEVEEKEADKILVSMRINFDFDKSAIREEEYPTMTRVGEILNTYPQAMVHISGHTDSIGTLDYNIALSQRRINSVMRFLTTKESVASSRFYLPVGYGELRPVADNAIPQGRFRNRRVEFLLYTRDVEPAVPKGTAILSVKKIDNSTVHIICNGKVEFKTNTLSDPHRFLVDLPGIFILSQQRTFELEAGPVIRARLGYHPDKTFSRVVFDLERPMQTDVRSVDNRVIIDIQ